MISLTRAAEPLTAGAADPAGLVPVAAPPARVAMLSYHTSPLAVLGGNETGGMNVYVRAVAERLAAGGARVDVFTRRDDPGAPEVIEFAPGARLVHVTAGPAAHVDKDALVDHVDAFAAGVEAFALAGRHGTGEHGTGGQGYDVIHSHYWLSTLAGERLARAWDLPHVTMFHTLGEVKLRARASEREAPARLEAERRLVHGVDRIVAATDHERRVLHQIYRVPPQRIAVVPLGVDLERFRPRDRVAARGALGVDPAERILLAIGRIQPLKGLDILVRALGELTERRGVRLLIVGGDAQAAPEMARLQGVAREAGVADAVQFVGPVPHDALPRYYNAADVVVVPSFYESFGLVAVEAMASGVPVVASRVGGLPSTVADGQTGYLIPWRCPEPFAEKIELLLRNEPLRAALGAAGVARMRRYAWDAVAEALCHVYLDVIDARRRARTVRVVGGG